LLDKPKGTSGCGKSTFGEKLAQSFSIPFIDGDDLHPKANVDKMSRGEALTDEDRIPWLGAIRQKAIQVTHPIQGLSISERERSSRDEPYEEETRIREMAEIWETSQRDRTKQSNPSRSDLEENGTAMQEDIKRNNVSMKKACVIACSALKKSYRDFLRGDPSSDLHVVHIYLHVEIDELKRRMHQRKGHFMKESMLQSQLATLEEPTTERNTITIQQGTLDEQIQIATQQLEEMLRNTS
jgi:gluconokinase